MEIRDDHLGYFKLVPVLESSDIGSETLNSFYDLITTDQPLDRENDEIQQNGGIYTFTLRVSPFTVTVHLKNQLH